MTSRRLLLIGSGLALAILHARRRRVGTIEARVFRVANSAPDRAHPPIWLVMQMGSLAAVGAGTLLLRHRGERAAAVRLAVIGTAVWAGVKAVKPFIGRGRPAHHLEGVRVRGRPQTGLGFPSGHAAISITIALACPSLSRRARLALLVGALLTGFSRMYVGAHLPLDILGGYAIGIVVHDLTRPA